MSCNFANVDAAKVACFERALAHAKKNLPSPTLPGAERLGKNCVHWFLKHKSGVVLDPARLQFRAKGWWRTPDYSKAIGSGFLTKHPSARARRLMTRLTWSEEGRYVHGASN